MTVPDTTCVPEGIFLTTTAVSVPEGVVVSNCAAGFETLTVYVPVGVAVTVPPTVKVPVGVAVIVPLTGIATPDAFP